MKYNRVITIAGSDSGGGAGIQADIKTISACGCYASSAITAITVQNTLGVQSVFPIPTETIKGQIDAVLSDIGADAIKIGMLHSSEVMLTVRDCLSAYGNRNIVLDPVMVSTSGHKLMEDSAIETLINELMPCARIITPNIPEAEIILGRKIGGQNELTACAKELSMNGNISVLLKAGHLTDERLIDILYNAETDEIVSLESSRLYTKNTHGTGCTLSSAIASFIARGLPLTDAVRSAKDYITRAITSGSRYTLGHGFGPVDHFFAMRGNNDHEADSN